MTQQWSEVELGECNSFLKRSRWRNERASERAAAAGDQGHLRAGGEEGGGQAEWSSLSPLGRWSQHDKKKMFFLLILSGSGKKQIQTQEKYLMHHHLRNIILSVLWW